MRLLGDDVEVRPCAGGPDLVRGAEAVVDDEGRSHAVTRPVVAVCRCEKSGRMPWCDSTHKSVRQRPHVDPPLLGPDEHAPLR